ncbi:MAG: hypothetical protein ACYDHY_01665 [Acidiferrobacterales bacterium]
MRKLLQLVFGDMRNILSIALAIALAYMAQRWIPAASGWILVGAIIVAGFWQAV